MYCPHILAGDVLNENGGDIGGRGTGLGTGLETGLWADSQLPRGGHTGELGTIGGLGQRGGAAGYLLRYGGTVVVLRTS